MAGAGLEQREMELRLSAGTQIVALQRFLALQRPRSELLLVGDGAAGPGLGGLARGARD